MIRHITKIKTYWDESPNSRAIIYFAYKDVGICRIQINEGDNFATLYGLYVDEKYRNLVLPLCEITELTWKQIVFPIAAFHMASGEEYKFLIFNKRRFERYYHEFKKSEP